MLCYVTLSEAGVVYCEYIAVVLQEIFGLRADFWWPNFMELAYKFLSSNVVCWCVLVVSRKLDNMWDVSYCTYCTTIIYCRYFFYLLLGWNVLGRDSNFQLRSLQTTSRDAKPTQHIEITHPNNANLKLVFHKVASFHPHYLTFTPQTYHHPVHRFRSWPMQTTSQSYPHTQVRVQPRNTYNHAYTKFLPGENKITPDLLQTNNVHSVHTRPCRIYEQTLPNNKLTICY